MGEATALRLAEAGCRVAVLDVELSRAEAVVGKIEAAGGSAFALAGDVLDDAKLKAVIAEADEKLGGIDVMATVIGMAAWSKLVDMPEEIWDLDQRRNLRYFFVAGKTVATAMMKRGTPGAMVCVASVDGVRSAPYHASYGAAKAGLVSLVKSMAVEWAESGIRVNAVAPGAIVSPRIPLRSEADERESAGPVPMKRRGFADDIAKAGLFLLSDMSAYMTGQTIAVDGGYLSQSVFDYSRALARVPSGGTMGASN